jgi:hypothetical protein
MADGDDYVTVTTVLRGVRDRSIFVDRNLEDREQVSIPRSLLFGADDRAVERAAIGAEVRIRVRRWKADELELIPDRRQKAQRSLEL